MKKIIFITLFLMTFLLSAVHDKYDNFDLKGVVSDRTVLGRLIYAVDLYGIKATDYIAAKGIIENDKRIRGWVVVLDDITKTRVIFYGFKGLILQGLHQVTFDKDSINYEDISEKTINSEDWNMIEARETVLKKFKPLCDVKYDTVVLDKKERIVVYMIPAASNSDTMSLAAPQVFYTDKTGLHITEYKTFFMTCSTYKMKNERGEELKELDISIPEEIPTEILVFNSALHNITLNITSSDQKKWRVERGTIKEAEVKDKNENSGSETKKE